MPVVNRIYPQSQGNVGPAILQQNGPTFDIEITVPSALEQFLTQNGQPVPPPARGQALIDTGATMSAVDDAVIRSLGVSPIGLITAGTAGGPQSQNQYPARFVFAGLPFQIVFESPRATGVNLAGTGLIALIGRDVLSQVIFIYNGPLGTVTLGL